MSNAAALGESTHGVWTRAEAITLLGKPQVDRLLAAGTWTSPWPGVLTDAGHDLDATQRLAAAVLATPGTLAPFGDETPDEPGVRRRRAPVACARTAARYWGLPLIDDNDPCVGATEHLLDDVHVWGNLRTLVAEAPAGTGELLPDGRLIVPPPRELIRHQLVLPPDDVVRLASGLWATPPARNLYDLARMLSHEALVCAIDAALHRKLCTLADIVAMAEAHKGDVGAPALRAALDVADGRAESPGETLVRLILKPELPGLEPQVRLYDRWGEVVARFDLGDREVRLGVEADGKKGHAGSTMKAKDNARDSRTGSYGWWTERATWFDSRRRQTQLRARVVGVHRTLRARAA